jgi:hypothetical protein
LGGLSREWSMPLHQTNEAQATAGSTSTRGATAKRGSRKSRDSKKKHDAVDTRTGLRCQNRICSGAFCPSTETCLTESCYQRRWCWWQSLFFCLSATTRHPSQTKAFDITATYRCFAQPSRRMYDVVAAEPRRLSRRNGKWRARRFDSGLIQTVAARCLSASLRLRGTTISLTARMALTTPSP